MCGASLCPSVDECVFFSCVRLSESVCLRGEKNKGCDEHLQVRAPGEGDAQTCRLPRGPAGSPITPTQAPAVKHIPPTHSLFSFSPSPPFLFCIIGLPPVLSQLLHFSLPLLCSHSIFSTLLSGSPRAVSRAACQPAASTPTLAMRGFSQAPTDRETGR